MLASFAVLRRPQAGHDRLPASSRDSLEADGLRTVFARYIRRIGRIATGSSYFVVPATIRTRLARACMKRLSVGQRAHQRRLQRRLQRTLFLWLDNFDEGGADYGIVAADAIAGKAFASSDGPSPPGESDPSQVPVSVAVLAPDGAVSLEARYPAEPVITAPIAGNFATFVHTIHIKPDARGFPNFNPEVAIFKKLDGT
ncbi:MAG: hypothetical protein M3401_06490, partial [Actinomycetota bacterium]|nr:hypothetical protein [Actinomycetota bacterium]